jgi:dipeptidyl-peptidase 4
MKNSLALLIVFYLPVALWAQKQISVEDFTTRNTFAQKTINEINWMKDGKYYSALSENKIIRYDVTNGNALETIVDGNAFLPAVEIDDYSFSSDESLVMLSSEQESIYRRSYTAHYFVYNRSGKSLKKVSSGGKQSYATFSPDGKKVAFARANNLFVVDLNTMSETQITEDGKFNKIINGTTDWVYEEEFSFVVGFYWSPDSKKIAYYKFNEEAVREYNLQRWKKGQLYPEDYRFKYPKAGEANSGVQAWIYEVASGKHVRADVGSEADIYLPRIKWTNNPSLLSVRKLNRLQNLLEIIHVDAETGSSKVVLTEKSDSYVDIEFLDDLTYLADGKQFVHSSERSGFKHLYLYSMSGTLIKKLTDGGFEVSEFLGLDEKTKTIFYTSTEPSALEQHLYSISFDGRKKTKLTQLPGKHQINMSGDFQFYIDHHSSAENPVVATLYRTKGNTVVKVLETNDNLKKAVDEFGLVKKEFFSFKAVDGAMVNGFMLKPKDFDPSRQYPLLLYQYSGPGSQNVANAWAGSHFYFHQMLAQKGYIVAVIDPRGTGARGEQFKKVTYKQLGKYELEDIVSAAEYFRQLPYVDDSRLGVWGWSYGGYMSSLAMTKSAGVFKMGIAVSPVTNWRFYDTVYTERYLQTPQLNASGYDDNSPLTYADKLQGNFLLIHGTGDDNVHFQNSIVFQDALINSGKKFESFYYPDKTHSIGGGKTRLHLYTLMMDYIAKSL